MRPYTFSIIGAGNLGANLATALGTREYRLKHIYKKSKFDHFADYVNNDIEQVVKESDIIFISTQESKIRETADFVARHSKPAGKFFFHTSNSLASDELHSLKEKGGLTASFSPLQTFPGFAPGENDLLEIFKGIYFLVEGDSLALKVADEISSLLGAFTIQVEKEDKVHIHTAAVASANFLIALMRFARQQLEKCQGDYKINIMLPLVKQTLHNIEKKGLDAALSGPARRREKQVLQKHLSLLDEKETIFYNTLTEYLK